ncbi:hypothetical protein GCM10010112_27660 [Actinoplanes lobatus]|uniref:Uncharacterized protein n=1 Tax=Actinoplanes lobatus TaxID=113568 RepID=A0A7W7HPS7_9ACTN|nr:hypothetical protein [Actinoplanes lobatus]MBB4754476.1 hypothetical protein [Actinoplanes lobatus]GGN65852.1 hypothetical protein GCM10010112_27660 [Actinoplanes lobatus]GIE40448.1 hypothetical protein Alo02nite_33460 [Actinoplanes lobatus]
MDHPAPRFAVAFVRSVAVLALEADAQTAWLQRLGTAPSADELACEFDDGFRLAPTFIERGWLSGTAIPALTQLDDQLSAMSGNPNADLWHIDALPHRAEWNRVRTLARAALILLA